MTKKRILITGASSGFGLLAVRALLRRGHIVLAGLRGGQDRMHQLFAQELRQYPDALHAVDLHLEREETMEEAAKWIVARWKGELDALVNNAGYGLFGALEDQSVEQLRRQLEVNFFGPVLLTRRLLPFLRASRGRVLNISSIAGRYTFPLYGSYCASKHALEALTEGLHYELKPLGVQVGLIEPGGFRTDFSTRSRQVALPGDSPYSARTRKLLHLFEVGSSRLGNPERVARLIVKRVEQRRIPLRSLIGVDARFMAIFARLVPDSWRVAGEEWFFRKVVFRD